jgi:hypothetical protein
MLTQHDIDHGSNTKRIHKHRRYILYRSLIHWTRDYWGRPRDLREAVRACVAKEIVI